jgi:hypothetical protein
MSRALGLWRDIDRGDTGEAGPEAAIGLGPGAIQNASAEMTSPMALVLSAR